jgi:tetratricopeptide (TPR) repeat protein
MLPDREREELELWLMEQALRVAHALENRANAREDWQRALEYLDKVSPALPPPDLEATRRSLRGKLGIPEPPRQTDLLTRHLAPPAWVEDYLRGVEEEPSQAKKALAHYERVIAARPGSFWAHYRAASAAFRLGEFDAAAKHIETCIAQRPKNPALRVQVAGCYFKLGRFDEALDACAFAARLAPDLAEAYRSRTMIWSRLGQISNMRADIDRFEILTRGHGRAPVLKLRIDSETATLPPSPAGGKMLDPAAEELASQALAVDPEDDQIRIKLASRLAESGRLEPALVELDRVLDDNPDYLEARYFRAMVLTAMGRSEAVSDLEAFVDHPRLEEYLREFPPSLRAFQFLALHRLREGRVRDATALAERELSLADAMKTLQGESHYYVALTLAASASGPAQSVQQIAKHLNDAYKVSPEYVDVWFVREPIFDPVRAKLGPLLVSRGAGEL